MKLKCLLFVALVAGNTCTIAQPCLVSSYPFNGNANDATGSNNGVVTEAVLTTGHDGTANSAYYFDGVNDYIQVSEDFDYPEKTVCLWFNATTITSSTGEIFGTDYPGLTNGNMGAAVLDISGTKYLRFFAGGVLANQFDYTINANQWYHLAMVKSASGYKYYVNCVLVKTCSASNNTSSSGLPGTMFGTDRALTRYFNGVIDNVSITNCALTDVEICNKYNSVAQFESGSETFHLYPNPATAGSILKLDLGQTKISSIEIINAMGEKVYSSPMNISGNVNLDPAVFVPGIYFVNLKNGNTQVGVRKFVVE